MLHPARHITRHDSIHDGVLVQALRRVARDSTRRDYLARIGERNGRRGARLYPAIPLLPRTVNGDIEFHGVDWRDGDRLVLLISAANADPRIFEAAGGFDAARRPNRGPSPSAQDRTFALEPIWLGWNYAC
ncbi:cytochrome P450 [Mycolicibacterium boenickei]|nr:cytochrome P450 [Mycolicibacterium boenickei]